MEPRDLAATYFRAWSERDFDAFQSVLAEHATFAGPLGRAEGASELRAGIERMSEIVTDIDVRHVFADGPDVLTWFDLHTTVAPPTPVANWSHVDAGRIDRVLVTFDPRRLTRS
jgi:hypothetical protein